jgi:hypothetical protein
MSGLCLFFITVCEDRMIIELRPLAVKQPGQIANFGVHWYTMLGISQELYQII